MKAKHIITISLLIASIAVSFVVIRKILRKKLVDQVRGKYGEIPGLENKTNDQLKEMLASGGEQG